MSTTIRVEGELGYASQDARHIQATAGTKLDLSARMFGQEVAIKMLASGELSVRVQRAGQAPQEIHLGADPAMGKPTDVQKGAYATFKSAKGATGHAWPMPWEGQPAKPGKKAGKKAQKPATQESAPATSGASPELLALAKKNAGKASQPAPVDAQAQLLAELAKNPDMLALLASLANKA